MGISLGPMRLIFVELSCLQAKIENCHVKLTPVTSKIGQGHPSSNLTKTLLRYIHGISFGSMRLIFVELSCLQAKCWRTDTQTNRRTDRQTDRWTRQSNSRVGYTQPAQNICWVIVFTSEMLTDRQTDGQMDRQTDGHANLIVGLVTRNPPKNQAVTCMHIRKQLGRSTKTSMLS